MKYFFSFLFICITLPLFSQGLSTYKLPNGLTVMVWEDDNQPNVFGRVAVNVGSADEPLEYTGLAHYLEHVMFKGTNKIGSLDWTKEEPIYQNIIAKYDEMAEESDPEKKTAIANEINQLTIEAAKYSVSNEFSFLIENIGGTYLNASTWYDYTNYHNFFPPAQINKWLEISSRRFIDPVYRAFQTELETVYEEYNRAQDDPQSNYRNYLYSIAFQGHPYGRSVIGLPEHLKNPRLSQLIAFYDKYYVPENMVLILVGNIKAKEVMPRITATFGRLQNKPAPTVTDRKVSPITSKEQFSAKVGSYPMLTLVYNGIAPNSKQANTLSVAMELLNNSDRTGVLDKLFLDGEVAYAVSTSLELKEGGRIIIQAMPTFDKNLRKFESLNTVEKLVTKAIEKLQKGPIEDWKLDAIKGKMIRESELAFESSEDIATILQKAFIYGIDINEILNYKEIIASITIDDVKKELNQVFNNNYITIKTEKGNTKNDNSIKKPDYDPIELLNEKSKYANNFMNIPTVDKEPSFVDFASISTKQVNKKSKLWYKKNTVNDIFLLTLRYGVGNNEFPKLDYAVSLLNTAGIQQMFDPQQLKQALSILNVTVSYSVRDNYFSITLYGYEQGLKEACQLLSSQLLMPKLDDKQLSQLTGRTFGDRQSRKDNAQILSNALSEYLCYGDNSSYIKELTDKEVNDLVISELTGDVNRAINYEADIFYTGSLSMDSVYTTLTQNLPLVADEKSSTSPQDKELASVTENVVYFLPNNKTEQAHLYFFMPTLKYDLKNKVIMDVFTQYYSGGFNSLIIKEIREKNSMAYQAGAYLVPPINIGNPTYLYGFVGTQNDKANDALDIFMTLIREMPENEARLDEIKTFLKQDYLTTKPNFRNQASQIENWERLGLDHDPTEDYLKALDALTFEDFLNFYKTNIQNQPMAIGIMGNTNSIDKERLNKYGKVININDKKLFNSKDSFF